MSIARASARRHPTLRRAPTIKPVPLTRVQNVGHASRSLFRRAPIRQVRYRHLGPFAESKAQSDAVTDLQYYLMAIPKDVSNEEKGDRLQEVADVVANVE